MRLLTLWKVGLGILRSGAAWLEMLELKRPSYKMAAAVEGADRAVVPG